MWNWHIKYICDELQVVAERVFKGLPRAYDLIINVSPGSTKSSICSVFFPAWVWTRMTSAKIIGGSYAKPLALDLALKNRDVVLSDKYLAAFPDVRLRYDQSAKSEFLTTKRGMRYSVGVGGSVTGKHGHFIIVDDPLNPKEAASEAELKTANEWMSSTLSTRKVDKTITVTILIMQRLHQIDPTATMISRAKLTQQIDGGKIKIKHICLPAELSDKVKPRKLRQYYKDGLMDPIRLSQQVLNEAKAEGDYHFAGQFMQWPIPAGGGMFKTDRIQIDIPHKKFVKIVRFWDKAGTQGGRGAYTVGLKMAVDIKKRFWLLDLVRGRWDSSAREMIIKHTAEVDGRGVIVGVEQEPGSGGKESAENTVRNLAGWRVRVYRPTGDKATRADPFSVQVNHGNVSMVIGEWNDAYLNELMFFPDSEFKDQVDTSSGAFQMLVSRKVVGAFGRV